MSSTDERFLRDLRETFRAEAREHLQAIGSGLLEFERAPAGAERMRRVEETFRAAHSLKGAARAVNFTEIESTCQSLEELFASWKRGESTPTPETLDTAHRCLERMTDAIDAATPIAAPPDRPAPSPPAPSPPAPSPPAPPPR